MSKKIQKRTFRKKNEMYKPQTLCCPYCGCKAILRPTGFLFGNKADTDVSTHYYACLNYPECNTYIPCYRGNFVPKGKLANAHLRYRRVVAHRYIDLIVKNGIMFQHNIYSAVASKLGISVENAHIRFSTDYSIEKTIEILREILDNHNVKYNLNGIESSYLNLVKKAV